MPSQPLNDLLSKPGSAQQRLLRKAGQLEKLQLQLHQCLPASLAPHVQLANLRDGRLLLTADSAVWASKLRYLSVDLLQQLNAAGWPCQHIDIKVATVYAPPSAIKIKRVISEPAKRLLLQTAGHIDDPRLAASLEKLAKHKNPSS